MAPAPQQASGENDRFWRMWMDNQTYLRKQLSYMLRNRPADVDDVLGNAMLKALTQFNLHAGTIDNERAWLARLVRNVCIDQYRSNTRFSLWLERVVRDELHSCLHPTEAVRTPTPEEHLETSQAMNSLVELLNQLPETLRRPMIMRFVDDMAYEEIADELTLSNGTVRKRVQLARKFLRQRGTPPSFEG